MKVLISFLSDNINDNLLYRYNCIKKSINNNYDIKYIMPTNKNIYNCKDNKDIVYLNIDKDIIFDHNNNNHTKNHLFYIEVYKLFPNYDKYIFIEHDVLVNNDNLEDGWKFVFNKLNKYLDVDLICTKLHFYKDEVQYQLRYNEEILNKYNSNFDYNKLLFGFFPFCMLSNKLIYYVNQYYKNYDGFFEYIIPSIAHKYNLKILSLINLTLDVENKFNSPHNINNGSISWNIEYKRNYPKNVLIHPIK